MANSMFGFPNRIDTSTLSGGSWVSTLPQSNIKKRKLGQVARTTNAAAANTVVNIDQTAPRTVRLVAVINHNFTTTAQYRLRCSEDPAFATAAFDSGLVNVWPVMFPYETLEWEDDNWWSGTYSQEQLAGYTPTLTIILPKNYSYRYWRLEIFDTGNLDGFVQMGRIFIGPVWQPAKNPAYGLGLGLETLTDVAPALSGSESFQYRKPYRVTSFVLENMTEAEGMGSAFEMDRQAGIDKEVFFVYDPADTVHAIRRQFLSRFRQLSKLEFPNYSQTKKAYEIKELL